MEMLKYSRRFTKDQKFSILSEHFEEGVSISELSCKHQVSTHTICKWRNAIKTQDEDKKISLDTEQRHIEVKFSVSWIFVDLLKVICYFDPDFKITGFLPLCLIRKF